MASRVSELERIGCSAQLTRCPVVKRLPVQLQHHISPLMAV